MVGGTGHYLNSGIDLLGSVIDLIKTHGDRLAHTSKPEQICGRTVSRLANLNLKFWSRARDLSRNQEMIGIPERALSGESAKSRFTTSARLIVGIDG